MKSKNYAGFATGTKVSTAEHWIPIEKLKIGDMVLCRHQYNERELICKPITHVHKYENKPLWRLLFEIDWGSVNIQEQTVNTFLLEVLVTPDHYVCVIAQGVMDDPHPDYYKLDSIEYYDKPRWKRVDELQLNEVIVSQDGLIFYVKNVQPIYQFNNTKSPKVDPSIAWYKDLDASGENIETGTALDMDEYYRHGNLSAARISQKIDDLLESSIQIKNEWKDDNNQYLAFTDTVYNIEVEDGYSYFVDNIPI